MTWLVLVNPGAGARPLAVNRIAAALSASRIDAEVTVPASAEALRTALDRAWAAGRRQFVVVGGDGTINLAVNHLVGRGERATLGILPSGTGSDLARTFGLPSKLEDASPTWPAIGSTPSTWAYWREASDVGCSPTSPRQELEEQPPRLLRSCQGGSGPPGTSPRSA